MVMQEEQVALAIIFGTLLGPVPVVVLAVYLCCVKDVCKLRGNQREQRSYTPMKKLDSAENVDNPSTNPDQEFQGSVAPQIE